MACPDRLENIFIDKKAIDLHVNVGHQTSYGCFDGNPNEEAVRRQFSADQLIDSNLRHIGLRTHYSIPEIPSHSPEDFFIPSISINWINLDPVLLNAQLNRLSSPAIVWFQSFRDPHHQQVVDSKYKQATSAWGKESVTISHTDDLGRLKRETFEILEVARAHKSIIATPHSNPERTVPLIIEAAKMGLAILWVHPDSRLINTPIELQQALAHQFPNQVYIERAAVFLRDGKPGFYSAEKTVDESQKIGIEHIIFTTDLGRYKETDPLTPDEGLKWYMEQLLCTGMEIEEVEMGIITNPNQLIHHNL